MIRLIGSARRIQFAHSRAGRGALLALAYETPKEYAGCNAPKPSLQSAPSPRHDILHAGLSTTISECFGLLACLSYAIMLSCVPVLAKGEASAEIGDKNKVSLEIARSEKEIQHGLMERASMPEQHGMVFLFRPARIERFWMGHCLMSLDMLFIKDGKILTITQEAPPYTGQDPTQAPLYPAAGPVEVSEVIELNSGYCKRHGVKEGDTVKFELPPDSAKKKHD